MGEATMRMRPTAHLSSSLTVSLQRTHTHTHTYAAKPEMLRIINFFSLWQIRPTNSLIRRLLPFASCTSFSFFPSNRRWNFRCLRNANGQTYPRLFTCEYHYSPLYLYMVRCELFSSSRLFFLVERARILCCVHEIHSLLAANYPCVQGGLNQRT